MRCLTLTERGAEPGIEISRENFAHVEIGVPGEHTRQTWFPLAVAFANSYTAERLDRAYVLHTRARGSLLIVEERAEDGKALIKLAIAPGLNGGVAYTSPSYREVPCIVRGNEERLPVEAAGRVAGMDRVLCSICKTWGWDDPESPAGWRHADEGTTRRYEPLARGRTFTAKSQPGTMAVIAEGTRPVPGTEEGSARVYQEMVAEVNLDASWRVCRWGNTYHPDGSWNERIYTWTEDGLVYEDPFLPKLGARSAEVAG